MADRDTIIKENIQLIGEESFPDDEVKWNIKGTKDKGEYTFVESEPLPATVGYDKFTFVLRFKDDRSYTVAGCYCWDNNKWSLLFTNPKGKNDWKAIFNGI